jgi:hypothetical protein
MKNRLAMTHMSHGKRTPASESAQQFAVFFHVSGSRRRGRQMPRVALPKEVGTYLVPMPFRRHVARCGRRKRENAAVQFAALKERLAAGG